MEEDDERNAMLMAPVDATPIPQRIQQFADEMRDLFADAFVEKSHNERLVQDASIGASTALSSRRKPIDGALAQILSTDKAQLEMSGPDDLNSWLIDRVRLIGNPKIKKKDIQKALAIIATNRPHLHHDLYPEELGVLAATSVSDVEKEGRKRYEDDLKVPWHVWAPAPNRPQLAPGQINAMDSKDVQIDENPRGVRYDPNTPSLEPKQPQQQQRRQDQKDPDVNMPPIATVVVTQQQQQPQSQRVVYGPNLPVSGGDTVQPQQSLYSQTLGESKGDGGIHGLSNKGQYYGGIADWFAPSEKQKKQAAEAKILKVLQKTSHPALVFARDYYLTYDRNFDPVKIQSLPMQQTLHRTRATLEMFRNSNRGSDYELIKVLLDRDVLEADLALDPAREDKLSELEKLLKERWSRIKLVHV